MLFNSIQYFLFLPLVVLLYYSVAHKYRWVVLLSASYFFYAVWRFDFLLLIVGSTLLDYWTGLKMGNLENKKSRKPYLLLSIIFNLGLLIFFKYLGFLNDTFYDLFNLMGWNYPDYSFDIILPIGISFYTFQTMSYSIDVYRGNQKPERHLGMFALYVSFFPQLLAGPIERAKKLIPQFKTEHHFNLTEVIEGSKLIAWGLFKKMVIADRLGLYINQYYESPLFYTGPEWMLIQMFFVFQIYLDFSAYSDIAVGTARILGFKLSINFDRPFRTKSIPELWNKWHITLGKWMKDYVYVSLTIDKKKTTTRTLLSLALVFILLGLWHGARWNFVIFGLIHAVLYLIYRTIRKEDKSNQNILLNGLKVLWTFILFTVASIFFRAETIVDANHILREFRTSIFHLHHIDILHLGILKTHILVLGLSFLVFFFVQNQKNYSPLNPLSNVSITPIRWAVYVFIIFMLIVFGHQMSDQFIYYQF